MLIAIAIIKLLSTTPAYSFDQLVVDLETEPTIHQLDSADDSAVLVNKINPEDSLIFATDKNMGLLVYEMSGKLNQIFPIGALNNVDILQDVHYRNTSLNIIGVSNKSNHALELYTYSDRGLIPFAQVRAPEGSKVYGLCLGMLNNQLQAFISVKNKGFYHYAFNANQQTLELKRILALKSTSEGCVVDTEFNRVLITEEETGLWSFDLDSTNSEGRLVQTVNNDFLVADLEGIALIDENPGHGYVVISSQGNNSFALFDRISLKYLKSFQLRGNSEIDFVTGTDGIHVAQANLGSQFPNGAFIAQDNENTDNEGNLLNQNFKLISLDKIFAWIRRP